MSEEFVTIHHCVDQAQAYGVVTVRCACGWAAWFQYDQWASEAHVRANLAMRAHIVEDMGR